MKHDDIIEKLKTARYFSETYQPLSWQGTVDFLKSVLASDVHTDTTDDRIVELAVKYTAAANAAGYELYQPERVLRRYRDLRMREHARLLLKEYVMQSKELLKKMAQAAVKYGDRDLRRRGHLINTYMDKTLTDEEIVDAAIWLASGREPATASGRG